VKKTLFLLLSMSLCAIWVSAQDYPKSDSRQTSTQTSTQTGTSDQAMKVQGCLSGSNGNFSLADDSGKTYQLAGDTSKLTEHVGHKVEITGTTSSSGAGSSSSSSAGAGTTLNVSSLKHMASSCGASH